MFNRNAHAVPETRKRPGADPEKRGIRATHGLHSLPQAHSSYYRQDPLPPQGVRRPLAGSFGFVGDWALPPVPGIRAPWR